MARQRTDPKKGVSVKIEGKNALKVIKVIEKTHRTFASEVNVAVENHTNQQLKEEK